MFGTPHPAPSSTQRHSCQWTDCLQYLVNGIPLQSFELTMRTYDGNFLRQLYGATFLTDEASCNFARPACRKRKEGRDSANEFYAFFSSSMADVALWLGSYMSISSKMSFVQGPKRSGNAGKSQQTNHHTDQPDDPQIPARLAFPQKQQQTRHTKRGKSPNKNTTKRFAIGHSGLTTASHSKTCIQWIKNHDIQWHMKV